MSNLFYAPRIYSQDSAKLYFRATGTSSPQNVYTDADLTVAHSNPVVANSNGYFDPIYLDPTLPDYRVIHTDGSDAGDDYTLETLLWPILDDVPSSSNTAQTYRVKGVAPEIVFEETDATTDNKKWRARVQAEAFTIDIGDDAESTWTNVFSIDRAGAFSDFGGDPFVSGESGTFTATLSGMSSATTGTMTYQRIGGLVILYCNADITGTSNSTAMTITGMPAAIVPKTSAPDRYAVVNGIIDDSNYLSGTAALDYPVSSWVWTLQVTGGFTASGTKGLANGFTLMYVL